MLLEDIDAMAKAINELIDDCAKRVKYSSMSENNAQRYDMTTILNDWLSLLQAFDSNGMVLD